MVAGLSSAIACLETITPDSCFATFNRIQFLFCYLLLWLRKSSTIGRNATNLFITKLFSTGP